MKKMKMMLLAGTVNFFTACGGGGGSSTPIIDDDMSSRDAVGIMYHYPAEVCESEELLNELKLAVPDAYNWLLSAESNSVTCATYGKIEGIDCEVEDTGFLEYDTSCVFGFDIDVAPLSTKSSKVIGDVPEWQEDVFLAAEFAMDAQE